MYQSAMTHPAVVPLRKALRFQKVVTECTDILEMVAAYLEALDLAALRAVNYTLAQKIQLATLQRRHFEQTIREFEQLDFHRFHRWLVCYTERTRPDYNSFRERDRVEYKIKSELMHAIRIMIVIGVSSLGAMGAESLLAEGNVYGVTFGIIIRLAVLLLVKPMKPFFSDSEESPASILASRTALIESRFTTDNQAVLSPQEITACLPRALTVLPEDNREVLFNASLSLVRKIHQQGSEPPLTLSSSAIKLVPRVPCVVIDMMPEMKVDHHSNFFRQRRLITQAKETGEHANNLSVTLTSRKCD